MSILAVDSSARRRAVLAWTSAGGDLLDSVVLEGTLLSGLGAALQRLLRGRPEAVVVATGPGSYTGLRAGMAAALGAAHAAGVPLHGAGSLEVVAMAAPEELTRFTAVADAGRGGVYTAACSRSRGTLLVGVAERRALAEIGDGGTLVGLDDLPGLEVRGDPAAALAAAVPPALEGSPLPLVGLQARYLDATGGSREA